MIDQKPKIFLSYAHEDIGMAKRIYQDLKRYGLDIWFDNESLLGGQDWKFEINKAIKESNFFIALLSPESINKIGEVQRELKTALEILEKYPISQVYLLPVRIKKCDPIEEKLSKLHWIDVFPESKYQNGLKKILQVVCKEALLLRNKPKTLSEGDATEMIMRLDFYDKYRNPEGEGFNHKYELKEINGDKVVFDKATGLMWQQGGSAEERMFEDANNWIKELYQRKFAGFNDWRLPTLEEAMSLVERERNNDDLYIDPVFNKKQDWIWTKDLFPGEWWAWIVLFDSGRCVSDYFDSGKYVRAVRSGHYDKSD